MQVVAGVVAALALLVSFSVDFSNTMQGGSIDLRNRITGVRLFENGLDAYYYKWHEGDPEEYCDVYNNPKLPVSKTTVTPTLLLLHAPYAAVPYRLGQFLWLFTQWGLLLGTGLLWFCACPKPWQRWVIVAFMIGFSFTAAWRLHAERGQSYVLLAFVFSAWLTLTLNRAWKESFAAGFLAGFLMTLRPTFLLLSLFIGLHRRGQLPGALTGLAICFLGPLLIHPPVWSEYFKAVDTNAYLFLQHIDPRPGQQHYPPTIEGTSTDLLGNFVAIPYARFSVYDFLDGLPLERIPVQVVPAIAAGFFCLWLWFTRKIEADLLLPGLAASFFLIDLFLPVFRESYNDVLVLPLAGSALAVTSRFPWALGFCLLALPCGWLVYALTLDDPIMIDLPPIFFSIGSLFFLFFIDNRWGLRKV